MTTLGLNVLQGSSPDAAEAWLRMTRARHAVVINEPGTAARLQKIVQVVYRRKAAGDDDDLALERDADAFVEARHREAPAGAWLGLTNEPGRGDLPRLNAWTVDAIRACERRGRRAVILNLQVGNPEPGDWQILRACCKAAKAGGHVLGLHEYWYKTPVDGDGFLIGRWRMAAKELGADCPPVLITELGYAADGDPHAGWVGRLSADDYGAALVRVGAAYRAGGLLGACVFSFGSMPPWGAFNVENEPKIEAQVAAFNASLPAAPPVVIVGAPTGDGEQVRLVSLPNATLRRNLRQQPDVASGVMGAVALQQRVTAWPRAKIGDWMYVRTGSEQGWMLIEPGVEFKAEMLAPPPPPAIVQPPPTQGLYSAWLTADEVRQLADLETQRAQLHRQIAELETRLAGIGAQVVTLLQNAVQRAA